MWSDNRSILPWGAVHRDDGRHSRPGRFSASTCCCLTSDTSPAGFRTDDGETETARHPGSEIDAANIDAAPARIRIRRRENSCTRNSRYSPSFLPPHHYEVQCYLNLPSFLHLLQQCTKYPCIGAKSSSQIHVIHSQSLEAMERTAGISVILPVK